MSNLVISVLVFFLVCFIVLSVICIEETLQALIRMIRDKKQ